VLRQSMAARVLSAVQVPAEADDVCFNRAGDLVVINWCADRQDPQRRLASCRPRRLVEQLAEALGVSAPAWDAPPPPTASTAAPAAPAQPSWPQTHVWPSPARRSRRRPSRAKTIGLWVLGAILLGLLAGGIARTVIKRIASRTPAAAPAPPAKVTPPAPPAPAMGDLAGQLNFAGAQAVVLYDIGDGVAIEGDRVTVWLPVAPDSELDRKASELGTLEARAVGGAALSKQTQTGWWLVQSRVFFSPNHKRLYDRIRFPGNDRHAEKLWRSPHTLIRSSAPAGESGGPPEPARIIRYDMATTN